MNRRAKKIRLTPAISLIIAALLLIAGLITLWSLDHTSVRERISQSTVRARILSSTVTAALFFNDRKAAQNYVNAMAADPGVLTVTVYQADGSMFVGFSRAKHPPMPRAPALGTWVVDGRVNIAVPVVQDAASIGVVYLQTSNTPLINRLLRYGLMGLLVTMAAVVVAVLGQTQKTLARTNAQLEDRVRERTATLEATNLQLGREIDERERSQRMAVQAQDRFRFLFARNPLPMWVYDRDDLRFLEVNDTAVAKYGFAPGEFAQMRVSDIRVAEDAGKAVDEIETRQVAQQHSGPWRHRTKNGRAIEVEISAHELDWDGRGAVLAVAEDVTDRRNLEQQLRQVQKMEAVGNLTGGIAHDFNNLLGVVTGNLDLLIEQLGDDAEAIELAEGALNGALRGAELTQRLLAFARKQPLQPKLVDLNQVLTGMIAMLRRTIREDITIDVKPSPELWPAVCDKSQVEDVVLNLAINARDAMPQGGTILVATENTHLDDDYVAREADVVAGDYVVLVIADSGTGMPREVIERAFEPFFTTKPVGQGTGLGLSMVYGFAKQSGGHVKIYSEIGHGTTIRVYLPKFSRGNVAAEAPENVETAILARDETILVVEDNPELRRMAVKLLCNLGYIVHECDNARGALGFLQGGERVDLLFSDIVMPGGMTGFDLAKAARELRPELKILLTSGHSEILVRNDAGGERQVEVISKPYRRLDLAKKIHGILTPRDG